MSQALARPTVRRRLDGTARKSILVVHIASAGAWLGIDVVMAVLVFTALGSDDRTKALSYQALEPVAVGPLLVTGLVCLLTGILLGLSSRYGLVRYWWVAAKLVLNLVLTGVVPDTECRPAPRVGPGRGGRGSLGRRARPPVRRPGARGTRCSAAPRRATA
jgi:hypothetical protein